MVSRATIVHVAWGLATAVIAVLVTWLLTPLTDTPSLAPLVAGVSIVSLMLGTGAGLAATVAGAVAGALLLFPPQFSFAISGGAAARTLLVAGLCVAVAIIGGQVRDGRRRLAAEREEHRATAEALQRALVPVPPRLDGVRVAQVFIPYGTGDSIGGDFLDAFMVRGGDIVLVVGDVCGKGPRAGQLASVARGAIRLAARPGASADGMLRAANAEVLAFTGASARFVAVTLVRIVTAAGDAAVEVACAGQPPPALLRPNGSVRMIGAPGMPLGIDADPVITTVRTRMRMGDVLVAYSDGVTEVRPRRGASVWGERGLSVALSQLGGESPGAVARAIESDVRARGDGHAGDDVAVLAAALTGTERQPVQTAMDLGTLRRTERARQDSNLRPSD